jgi:Vitamin K-dependent gamma-carboxylase
MRTPGQDAAQEADWNRFWFAPIDPTGLGFMRICAGLLVLYTHLAYSYDLFSYLGPHSWLDQQAQTWARKETSIYDPPDNWTDPPRKLEENAQYTWSIFYHVNDPFWVVVIHVSALAVMLLFTLGLWTRVTSVLTWMAAMCYLHRLSTSLFGMDTMLIIVLMYLMIGNCGATLSLDRWLERRRLRREQGDAADLALKPSWSANLAIRLIQIHFCVIYLTSGMSKLQGATWWSGTALWLCFANANFAPMRVGLYNQLLVFLCQNRWLWEIFMSASVAFTLFTEVCFTFLVWNKRWRPIMVACSVLMHVGIGVIMGLVVFSLFMLTMVLAFVPPDQMRIFVESLVDSMRRGKRGKEPSLTRSAGMKQPLAMSRT